MKYLALAVALHLAAPLAAQESLSRLQQGDRIRLTVPAQNNGRFVPGTGRWVVGRFISVDSTQVAMKVDGQGEESEYTVPFVAIQDFQLSRGVISAGEGRRRGAMRGAAVGAGLVGCLMVFATAVGGDFRQLPVREFAELGAGFGAGGAAIGFLMGGRSREKWSDVDDRRVALRVAPGQLSVQVATGR